MLNNILYYIVYSVLYLFSLLPFRVLYLFSDGIFLLLYYRIKYRREVVWKNLTNSFPDKSEEELKIIEKKHYRHFTDLIVETVKMLSISAKAVRRRVPLTNPELLNDYAEKGQSIVLVTAHIINWEYCGLELGLRYKGDFYAIYHPLQNRIFDRLIIHMRTRLGSKLYTMQDTVRGMIKNRKKTTATVFISDQVPSSDNSLRLIFLNQQTRVYKGAELLAKKMKYPVIYINGYKHKRGMYSFEGILVTEKPHETEEGEITKKCVRLLEKNIEQETPYWLWTHNRWKRT